jgi:hypothetical protein
MPCRPKVRLPIAALKMGRRTRGKPRQQYRIAPLTAVIVLLTPGAQQLGPLDSAFHRIVEITLGSFVGLGVSLVLLPARAHGLVIGAAARMPGHLADLLGDWLAVLAGSGDRTRVGQLQDDIRAEMARLEIVAGGCAIRLAASFASCQVTFS